MDKPVSVLNPEQALVTTFLLLFDAGVGALHSTARPGVRC